jgi:hypothetical protein
MDRLQHHSTVLDERIAQYQELIRMSKEEIDQLLYERRSLQNSRETSFALISPKEQQKEEDEERCKGGRDTGHVVDELSRPTSSRRQEEQQQEAERYHINRPFDEQAGHLREWLSSVEAIILSITQQLRDRREGYPMVDYAVFPELAPYHQNNPMYNPVAAAHLLTGRLAHLAKICKYTSNQQQQSRERVEDGQSPVMEQGQSPVMEQGQSPVMEPAEESHLRRQVSYLSLAHI